MSARVLHIDAKCSERMCSTCRGGVYQLAGSCRNCGKDCRVTLSRGHRKSHHTGYECPHCGTREVFV